MFSKSFSADGDIVLGKIVPQLVV